ncbi:hypothetical protein MTsDn1_25210 [Alteromonas sp. MTD1]|uniref:EAL domain-containing protein n=1 Tax=Alteromonas sp. MTD1 TaxID=3057962 RepID=UPI0036F36215
MRTIQSDIAVNTSASLAVVCALIITLSIYVYEDLYVDFLSEELDAIAGNLTVGLMRSDFQNSSFKQTEVLLGLDEYDYIERALVFDNEGSLLTRYEGQLQYPGGSDKKRILHSDNLAGLKEGIHHFETSLIVVKYIGDEEYRLGKLAIELDMKNELRASRWQFIVSTVPVVMILILACVSITTLLQKRSLRPLSLLIETMDSVVKERNFNVEVKIFRRKETAALSNAFNNMMSTIREQATRDREKNEQLELNQIDMERLVNIDLLTQLPNRQSLMSKLSNLLSEAQRKNSDVGLLFLDMDRFKSINDSFGHRVGDKFLQEVSNLIVRSLPQDTVFGRFGGDEFLILVENINSVETLSSLAKELKNAISEPLIIEGIRLHILLSIGMANARDANYDSSRLISNADAAMYKAKESGKGECVLFTPAMFAEMQRQNNISSKIAEGLLTGAFYVLYQAKIDKRKCVVGFEALLRWEDEELGFISPAEFIPIAEKNDKVSALTRFVIEKVCDDLPTIKRDFGDDIVVSVNLSPQDLNHVEITEFIINDMESGRIPSKNIEFEITETALMDNFKTANDFFDALKLQGARIALDDFGTGYSSLGYLSKLSIDTLKIDRQFVSQIGCSSVSETITKTIIEMAKALNCEVCAEGIETLVQASFLLEHDCNMLQGFLFSKPTAVAGLKGDLYHLIESPLLT